MKTKQRLHALRVLEPHRGRRELPDSSTRSFRELPREEPARPLRPRAVPAAAEEPARPTAAPAHNVFVALYELNKTRRQLGIIPIAKTRIKINSSPRVSRPIGLYRGWS